MLNEHEINQTSVQHFWGCIDHDFATGLDTYQQRMLTQAFLKALKPAMNDLKTNIVAFIKHLESEGGSYKDGQGEFYIGCEAGWDEALQKARLEIESTIKA